MVSNDVKKKLLKNKIIAGQYADHNNMLAMKKFPFNPNGSDLDIAALTNKKGNILAMIPHPERAFYFFHKLD